MLRFGIQIESDFDGPNSMSRRLLIVGVAPVCTGSVAVGVD